MNKSLCQHAQEAIKKGLTWLREHDRETLQIEDLSAHYKAPYLYAALGDPVRARFYAELMRNRFLQKDGDFRTGPFEKGWSHLPCSPANRYVYSNGWIIAGLRRLGFYGTARRGLEFILRFQSRELGGFFSRFDVKSGKVDPGYLDSSSSSSAGLALLACGLTNEACRTGDFILRLIDAQPEPDRYYFSSWKNGEGLMTDIRGDEDQNSIRGRKQYCLSAENNSMYELVWLIGKPMKFLGKLYDQTQEKKYLEGAINLFDFFHKLDEKRWQNLASCKIMWASAEIFRHTTERRFAETAERLLESLCERQHASGIWLHTLWYKNLSAQPFPSSLDTVQELCGEISDVLFELG